MLKYYLFPEPLDATCVLTTDGGIIIKGQPDTHPSNGAPCQSFEIPNTVPNSNGAGVLVTHVGLVKDQHHGILLWGELLPAFPKDQAGFLVDVFPLQKDPQPPWPPVPSRAEVIGPVTHFMGGLIVDAPQFGKMPWWDPCLPWCNAETRQAAYKVKKEAGDTHIICGVPCGLPLYNSGDNSRNFYRPDRFPALDWTNGLTALAPEWLALVHEVILAGFKPFIALQEEMSYSFPLMRLVAKALQSDQRQSAKYALMMPGFDGVFYGWPDADKNIPIWGGECRALCPDLALALEFNPGHIPLGQGPGDYADGGLMQAFDCVLGEFPTVVPFPAIPSDDANNVWEVLRRCVQPYHPDPRDPNQGSGPFYITASTRGQRTFVGFETWNPYNWVRVDPNNAAQVAASQSQIDAERMYFRARGCSYTG